MSSRAGDRSAGWSGGLGLGTLGGQRMEQVWPGREEACGFPGSCRTSGQRLDAESCTRALVCVLQGRTGTRSSALGLFVFPSLSGILPACGRGECLGSGNTAGNEAGACSPKSYMSPELHVGWFFFWFSQEITFRIFWQQLYFCPGIPKTNTQTKMPSKQVADTRINRVVGCV